MTRKTVLITGSTSGIGWGIAQAFARKGHRLVLNGLLDGDSAQKLIGQITVLGGEAMYHGADMRLPSAIAALVDAGTQTYGGVDILVNNAGIQHVSPIEDFSTQKWDDILAINLSSAFHTTRLCLPHMRQAGWGRVINMASAHGLVASAYKSAYVAAKHGMLGLTKTVALEVAEANITCNAICPGYVRTPLVDAQIPATAQARGISEDEVIQQVMLAHQPTKKFVTIDEVAAMVVFVAGDDARSINGASLSVDGGWVAK